MLIPTLYHTTTIVGRSVVLRKKLSYAHNEHRLAPLLLHLHLHRTGEDIGGMLRYACGQYNGKG